MNNELKQDLIDEAKALFELQALEAMKELGLTEDEAERELEDYQFNPYLI
jgi:hypothetical protein